MLVEFRFRNVACFRDEQVLSMVAEEDRRTGHLLASNLHLNPPGMPKGMSVTRSALVFGPNASGKSSIAKAIQAVHLWVSYPESSRLGCALCFGQAFRGDTAGAGSALSRFSVTFVHDSVRYKLEAEGRGEQVMTERLTAYPKNHAQLWYERIWDESSSRFDWRFGSHLKGPNRELASRTPAVASFLGVAATWEHPQLKSVASWFGRLNTRVSMSTHFPAERDALKEAVQRALSEVALAPQGGPFLAFLRQLVRGADLGIMDLHPFPGLAADEGKQVMSGLEKAFQLAEGALGEATRLTVGPSFQFLHRGNSSQPGFVLPEVAESDGTLRLLALSTELHDALSANGILVVDELDRSLHPALTQAIVGLFHDESSASTGPQLIGTVHDVTLLDPTILRRDQIWFTQKDSKGAASLFSLAEFKGVRKDDPFMRRYLAGVYGAVPDLDRFGVQP